MQFPFSQPSERLHDRRFTVAGNSHGPSGAGTVGVDHAGRTTLAFVWGWLSGVTGDGESSYVELAA